MAHSLTVRGGHTRVPRSMGVFDRLSRLITGAPPTHEVVQRLLECYLEAVVRSRLLLEHAELAPQEHSAERLRELAAGEEQQVQRLAEALRAAGQPPTVPQDVPPSRGTWNHWGRLVQDLEAHRRAVRRLRELATHFAESLPTTAQLFDELCHEESAHCEALRELIARADAQALD
jgi:ferritin-like protein